MQKIRQLRENDIKAIVLMMLEWPSSYPRGYVLSYKRGGIRWLLHYIVKEDNSLEGQSWVLEINKGVIGHIAYLKDVRCFEGGVYELRGIVVHEDFQKKNYGTKLIRHALKELRKIKARLVWLQTGEAATQYYRKLGFELIAEYKHYWGENKHRYVMGKYF
ncbi:GNAT family N-acetyltransferase [Patescibacteria group bacterium]|nr:MAG: GNAT family N-acetyltransferase [Patescibacteria group bacterium]